MTEPTACLLREDELRERHGGAAAEADLAVERADALRLAVEGDPYLRLVLVDGDLVDHPVAGGGDRVRLGVDGVERLRLGVVPAQPDLDLPLARLGPDHD